LYSLSEAEIELIEDRCQLDIDFFYNDAESKSVAKFNNLKSYYGSLHSLPSKKDLQNGLDRYLYTFINLWNTELANEQKLSFRVLYPHNSPLIAVVFNLQSNKSELIKTPLDSNNEEWSDLLGRLDKELHYEFSTKIFIEGIARVVTDEEIIIIKRNELGLWTSTSAREDVDATLLEAMIKQESHA